MELIGACASGIGLTLHLRLDVLPVKVLSADTYRLKADGYIQPSGSLGSRVANGLRVQCSGKVRQKRPLKSPHITSARTSLSASLQAKACLPGVDVVDVSDVR